MRGSFVESFRSVHNHATAILRNCLADNSIRLDLKDALTFALSHSNKIDCSHCTAELASLPSIVACLQ
jgi:hypothetical protein